VLTVSAIVYATLVRISAKHCLVNRENPTISLGYLQDVVRPASNFDCGAGYLAGYLVETFGDLGVGAG
jgi:hypothetical protein